MTSTPMPTNAPKSNTTKSYYISFGTFFLGKNSQFEALSTHNPPARPLSQHRQDQGASSACWRSDPRLRKPGSTSLYQTRQHRQVYLEVECSRPAQAQFGCKCAKLHYLVCNLCWQVLVVRVAWWIGWMLGLEVGGG